MLSLPAELVSTEAAVWGVSKYGASKFPSAETKAKLASVSRGKANEVEDALIAITSFVVADVLVTDDERFAKRVKAERDEFPVWNFAQFSQYVADLSKDRCE